jgi:polar amino acid transport system ATP-binding protein
MISIRNVHKWFGSLHVLDDVSLEVSRGSVVVIAGPSGSGKSTLLRTINGLEPIQSGEIRVDGVSVQDRKTDVNRLRQDIGMVFQRFNLFPHLTALDNVTLAPIHVKHVPRAEAEQLGMSLLTRVGIADRARYFPAQLSGGQQQPVVFGHPMAMSPICASLSR